MKEQTTFFGILQLSVNNLVRAVGAKQTYILRQSFGFPVFTHRNFHLPSIQQQPYGVACDYNWIANMGNRTLDCYIYFMALKKVIKKLIPTNEWICNVHSVKIGVKLSVYPVFYWLNNLTAHHISVLLAIIRGSQY